MDCESCKRFNLTSSVVKGEAKKEGEVNPLIARTQKKEDFMEFEGSLRTLRQDLFRISLQEKRSGCWELALSLCLSPPTQGTKLRKEILPHLHEDVDETPPSRIHV